jgi:predicted DCC family thiol-disulfide oxidoreductase YuxK
MTPELRRRAEMAMQVITVDGRGLEAGRAALFILTELQWRPWLTQILQRRPFIWLLDVGYPLVARNRHLISRWGGSSSCSLPRK